MRELVARRLRGGGLRLAGYVGGHPMAGRETAGFAAADPTPVRRLRLGALPRRGDPASTTGSRWPAWSPASAPGWCRPPPRTTTGSVAAVSHVPHLLAAALATAVSPTRSPARSAAGSFRDGTRVAASPPELIAAMCGGNAEPGPGRAGRRARPAGRGPRPRSTAATRSRRSGLGCAGPHGPDAWPQRLGRADADPGPRRRPAGAGRERRLGHRGRRRRPGTVARPSACYLDGLGPSGPGPQLPRCSDGRPASGPPPPDAAVSAPCQLRGSAPSRGGARGCR